MKRGEEENYTKSGFDILFLFYDAYHTILVTTVITKVK